MENRNHHRHDATLREDTTRGRSPNVLAYLALLRSVCLLLHSRDDSSSPWLPAKRERFTADPDSAKALILQPL